MGAYTTCMAKLLFLVSDKEELLDISSKRANKIRKKKEETNVSTQVFIDRNEVRFSMLRRGKEKKLVLARYIERPFCNIQISACCSLEELYTLYAFSSFFPLFSSFPQLFASSPLPRSVLCSRFMYGKHFPAPLKKCFLWPHCYSASPPSARAVPVECDRKKKVKRFGKQRKHRAGGKRQQQQWRHT